MKNTAAVEEFSDISDHHKIRKPMWHVAYYLLAAFDIATVLLTLGLTHRLVETYDHSVEVNRQWSARLLGYMQTAELAATVNLPGNNVFKSNDADTESARMHSAQLNFDTRMSEVRAELEANISDDQVRYEILQQLELIDTAVADMASEAELIFSDFRRDDSTSAGKRMVAMDEKFYVVNTTFSSLNRQVIDIQQEILDRQIAEAQMLRQWEILIALCVFLMVTAVLVYGHKLARKMLQDEVQKDRISGDLLKSNERFNAILTHMADGMIAIDENGIIQMFNLAAEGIFGYTADEVIGKNVSLLMPEPDAEKHNDYIVRYVAHGGGGVVGRRREIRGLRKDGSIFPLTLAIGKVKSQGGRQFIGTFTDLSERQKYEDKNKLLAAAVEHAVESVVIIDTKRVVQYANPQFERESGYSAEETVGRTPEEVGWARAGQEIYDELLQAIRDSKVWSGRLSSKARDGSLRDEEVTISPIVSRDGNTTNFVMIRRDVTERLQLERQLSHAQKLESIGQLAAGIAHEINTPSQYVGDNTRFLQEAYGDIDVLIDKLVELTANDGASIPREVILQALEDADVAYLQVEIPQAIEQSLEGMSRVTRIVQAMKEFSHPAQEKTTIDLNQAIESTITVATSEWKYVAEVETDFDPGLPPVSCVPGDFNQVILNLLVNASHAIADVMDDGAESKGTITVSTRHVDGFSEIRIADTGCGMPEDVRARIFDPFFTTKDVGKGTGQGLSIAYAIITEKHGGTIMVDSEPGRGTCFTIRLPLEEGSSIDANVESLVVSG